MLRRVVGQAGRATLVYFPARLVPALAAIVALPIFTSYLDTEAYGAYSYVFATVGFLATLSTAWLTTSAIRFFAPSEREDALRAYLSTLLISTVAASLLVSSIVAATQPLWSRLVSPSIGGLLLPGLALLFTTAVHGVLLQVLRAAQRPKAFALVSVPGALVGLLAGYLMLRGGWGPEALLYGQTIGHALVLPFGLYFSSAVVSHSRPLFDTGMLRQFAAYGMPLVAANLASWVLNLADRYVIEATRGVAEVGLYSFSYALADKGTQLVMVPFLMAISPVIVSAWESDGRELAEGLQAELSRYFVLLILPVSTAIAVAAPLIVELMSGSDEYLAGWRVLPFVTFGLGLYGLGQIGVTGISLGKRTSITMQNTAIAAAFNVVANIIVVPTLGFVAAGATTLVSYALLLVLHFYRCRVVLRWRIPPRAVVQAAVACIPLALILVAAQRLFASSWLIALAAGALSLAAYVVALLLLGGLDSEERAWIVARMRNLMAR